MMARSSRLGYGIVLIAVVVLLLVLACRTTATAGSVGEMLSNVCPDAYSVDRQEVRAHALADASQWRLAKEAAGLYYDCYQRLNDPYPRDMAHYEYLAFLSVSALPNDDSQTIQTLTIAAHGANELAASTPFSDVRKQALWLRDNCRDELKTFSSPP
jgi:hypothetical protein